MNRTEFVGWLRTVETAYPVAEWRAAGFRTWPMIRVGLYLASFKPHAGAPTPAPGAARRVRRAARPALSLLRSYVVDSRANVRPDAPADAVFLAYSMGGQPIVAGRRYNPLVAPYVALLAELGKRSVVWETAPGGEFNTPRYTPSAYIQPRLALAGLRRAPRGSQSAAVVLDGYADFARDAARRGLSLPHSDAAAVGRDATYVRQVADLFKGWLARSGASHAFTADYGLREQALCLACAELGVASVDVQHGMQGDLHPAFGSWFNVPRDGYELRPRIYWCWDEASAAAVERWAARTDRAFAVVGGDPWRDAWRSDGAPLVSPSDAEVAAAKAATGGSVHVLVSLDSTGAVIPPVILEAARRAPRSWCFWFRLHPLTVRTRLESTRRLVRATGATAADVAYASELPLFAILRQVDVHVTATWSTVVRDAAALGVPSVGCTPEARELFATEVAHGALRVASSPDELLAAIEEQRHRRLPTERAAPRSRGAMQRVLAGEPARAAEPVAS